MSIERVDLYFLKTAGLRENSLLPLVLDGDRAYANQFRDQERKIRALASRALRRWCLMSALNGAEPEVLVSDNGKPYLEGGPGFSCSSSPGLVATAVACSRELGLDVETRSRLDQLKMTESELREWITREAVAKGTGQGLSVALTGLSEAKKGVVSILPTNESWQFQFAELPIPWVGCVAKRLGSPYTIEVHEVTPTELIG